jgi:DNA-directed RNA polymerase specialized sigma24 family protein
MLGIFGFTQDEIAAHDGTNRKTVKANVNRGRDNMRQMLLLERSGLVFS